jgi:hypothetical protein
MRIDDDLLASGIDGRSAHEELIIREARQRHRRRLLVLAGIVAIMVVGAVMTAIELGGYGSSSHESSPNPTHVSPPLQITTLSRCHSGQINVTTITGGAGAGQRSQELGFENVGRSACTLVGYPTVVALNAAGVQVATASPTSVNGGNPQRLVTLKPGQKATATLWGAGHNGNDSPCGPGYASFLVIPPNMTQPVKVGAMDGWEPGDFPSCGGVSVDSVVPDIVVPVLPRPTPANPGFSNSPSTTVFGISGSTPTTGS